MAVASVSFRVVLAEGSSTLLLRQNASLARDLEGAVASVLGVESRFVTLLGITDGAFTARRRAQESAGSGAGCAIDIRAFVSAPTTDAAALSAAASAAQTAIAASLASDAAFLSSAWRPFVARFADAVGTSSARVDLPALMDIADFALIMQAFDGVVYSAMPSVVPNTTASAEPPPGQAGAALSAAAVLCGAIIAAAGLASCRLRARLAATAREATAKLRG